MKIIEVVAAVILKEDKFLATERGYGDLKGGWEFPGGKVEAGESQENALIREIKEELNISISVDRFLLTTEYDYPTFHLKMHCYLCTVTAGEIVLLEHSAARWLTKDTLDTVEWLEADIPVVKKIREML